MNFEDDRLEQRVAILEATLEEYRREVPPTKDSATRRALALTEHRDKAVRKLARDYLRLAKTISSPSDRA